MVVYHVFGGPIASLLKKILIKVPFVSLPNLVANRAIIPELLAHHFTVNNLQKELHKLLDTNDVYNLQKEDYETVATILGDPGTARRAAEMMVNHLLKDDLPVQRS